MNGMNVANTEPQQLKKVMQNFIENHLEVKV